jgi:5-methylthioadenosine/S-adenosylhomocysteine deaminase
VIDASNMIVMPGFIDTHHHSYQELLRGVLADGLLDPDYRRDLAILTPAYRAQDAYAGVLVSALSALSQGVTTVVDTSQVSNTPEHTDACIRAFQEAGLRTVFAYSRGAWPEQAYPQDIIRLRATYFSSEDQLLTLALGATLVEELFVAAREVGAPVVSHGVNDATEGALFALARAGLLGPASEYIHCTHLSDDAWALIRDTGGKVSLSVPIEMTMGHGMPGIQDALEHGVRPSLSSDVAVTLSADPFTIMRSAFTLQRLLLLQRERRGDENLPPLLTSRDVLELATVEGARCAGLERKVGTLTPGKDADIVLLRTDQINVWPVNNAAGAIVTLMDTSNVDAVFVAGKVMKWRGNLVGVDVPRVLRMAGEARDAVLREAGFPSDLLS